MSKVLTDQIEKRTGGTAMDVPASGKWPQGNIADDAIGASQMADDAVGTAALSATGTASTTTFLRGDNSWAAVDTTGINANKDDIALLAFKVAANGSFGRYNLVDQSVDAFEDATGVDASASTNEVRNSSGKYYSGTGSVTATGGTITTDGDYTIHKFTASGNLITDTAQSYEVLVIGGGGGGGKRHGGGGGAGGLIWIDGYSVTNATHAVVIGAGGSGSTTSGGNGTNGVSSTFMNLTALGGGVGASDGGQHNVNTGGSGGGSDDDATHGGLAAQPSTNDGHAGSGFGENGYGSSGGTSGTTGKGGGGAGQAGGAGATIHTGGDGKQFDIMVTGTNVYYGGGGGGGDYAAGGPTQGAGGQGGGGAGAPVNSPAVAGTANTGGGGGGEGSDNVPGGAGGSGVVILRRPTSGAAADMTLISNAQTAQAAPTKADVVLTYTNGSGTAVINTDLIASVSRDNGTTYTAVTLASQGTTGGHTILTANEVDISGQPAGTSMRWKVGTANQSISKETRIQAVSLGWS